MGMGDRRGWRVMMIMMGRRGQGLGMWHLEGRIRSSRSMEILELSNVLSTLNPLIVGRVYGFGDVDIS